MSIFTVGKQCGIVIAGDFNVAKPIFSNGKRLEIYNGLKKNIIINKEDVATYNVKATNINGFGATRVEIIFKDESKILIELDQFGTTVLERIMY